MYRNCLAETNRTAERDFLEQGKDFHDRVLLYFIRRTFIPQRSNARCFLLSIQLIMAKKFATATGPSVMEQKHKLNFSHGYLYRQHRDSAFRPLGDYFLGRHRHDLWVLPLPRKEQPGQTGALH